MIEEILKHYVYSVYLDNGQGAFFWKCEDIFNNHIEAGHDESQMCYACISSVLGHLFDVGAFGSIRTPILLGDGVLDEGPISEEKIFRI